MVLRFIALYLGVSIISYWMGAQDVGTFLPREFILVGALLHLQRQDKRSAETLAPSSKQLPQMALAR
jgi:hypothetical protein